MRIGIDCIRNPVPRRIYDELNERYISLSIEAERLNEWGEEYQSLFNKLNKKLEEREIRRSDNDLIMEANFLNMVEWVKTLKIDVPIEVRSIVAWSDANDK